MQSQIQVTKLYQYPLSSHSNNLAHVQNNTHLVHEDWNYFWTEEGKIMDLYYRFHSQCLTHNQHTVLHINCTVSFPSYSI